MTGVPDREVSGFQLFAFGLACFALGFACETALFVVFMGHR